MPVRSLPGEQWKLFPDSKTIYVSNMGRVKKGTKLKRILFDPDGYKLVNINGKAYRLHVIVAKLFVPNPNNLPIVDHKDTDKKNCKADNLEWVSYQENTQRYYDKLKEKGEKARHRTTNIVAIDSNDNLEIYDNQTKAAAGTGVTSRVINNILRGVTKSCRGFRFFRAESITDNRTKTGEK